MVEQEAPALLERFPAMARIAEAVVGPRDDVQGPRFGGPLAEPPAVVGRHHLLAVGLDHEHAGDAGGRVGSTVDSPGNRLSRRVWMSRGIDGNARA